MIKLLPKKNASDDPSNPGNFRPTALTSCVGKIYTTIIKDRWLSYMKSNNYFDTRIQKAFMPSVPGCVEHYVKLATAVSEARSLHKSLCVCWLDLANAYGSVHHNLISFSLQHYPYRNDHLVASMPHACYKVVKVQQPCHQVTLSLFKKYKLVATLCSNS